MLAYRHDRPPRSSGAPRTPRVRSAHVLRRAARTVLYAVILGLATFGVLFSALNDPWFLVAGVLIAGFLLVGSERSRRQRRRARERARLRARHSAGP